MRKQAAPGWRLRLSPADMPPPRRSGQGLTRSRRAPRSRPAADGEVVRLRDPDSGERLGALLTAEAGVGQPSPVRLVDLEVLPSIQGFAWRPSPTISRPGSSTGG